MCRNGTIHVLRSIMQKGARVFWQQVTVTRSWLCVKSLRCMWRQPVFVKQGILGYSEGLAPTNMLLNSKHELLSN